MPNTLVHFATHAAATRTFWRLDPRWIYLGCLLPDLPWILRRAVVAFGLPVDAVDLRLYTMAQASLAGTLLLAAALATLTAAPRVVWAVLGANALAHLLLDASEIKWGNGVHLLAPISWGMTRLELVSGDGALVPVLSTAGAFLAVWDLTTRRRPGIAFVWGGRRLAAAAAFAVAYFVAPFFFFAAIEASDSYSVKTVREVERRPGREVSLDRTALVVTEGGRFIELWNGERVRAAGAGPLHSARISLHGTFLKPDLLRIDRWVEHRQGRDWPSYVALILLGLLWIRPYWPYWPGKNVVD